MRPSRSIFYFYLRNGCRKSSFHQCMYFRWPYISQSMKAHWITTIAGLLLFLIYIEGYGLLRWHYFYSNLKWYPNCSLCRWPSPLSPNFPARGFHYSSEGHYGKWTVGLGQSLNCKGPDLHKYLFRIGSGHARLVQTLFDSLYNSMWAWGVGTAISWKEHYNRQ